VEDEHVEQADRDAHGEAAEQDAQEHRPGPPVLDQQQVDGQELGFSAAVSASTKNSAFLADQPASGIVAQPGTCQ
jgi:hypothetical protein